MTMPAGWITPDWPVPATVRAVCTTREGGVSAPPYDSLNLGDHVADLADSVATNRKVFSAAIQARPVFLSQVHGCRVVRLEAGSDDGIEADGCITTKRGIACTVMVADCLPVLFTNAQGSVVGCAHGGWRGLAGTGGAGILEAVCAALLGQTGALAADLLAWLGPCIGPDAFEVGSEVKAAFEASDPRAGALFRPHGKDKWLADLPGLARQRLRALGITRVYGNDGSPQWCTVANPSRFFSHRRDRVSGRFAGAVWLA
jgi:YfiH family protein